jgi:hypothetical protein
VQMTVAAITVNAQANSSPKRHEPLQGGCPGLRGI